MAKFICEGTPDLVVSTSNGFIQFKDYSYSTTRKAELEALRKCKNIIEDGKTTKEVAKEPVKAGLLG